MTDARRHCSACGRDEEELAAAAGAAARNAAAAVCPTCWRCSDCHGESYCGYHFFATHGECGRCVPVCGACAMCRPLHCRCPDASARHEYGFRPCDRCNLPLSRLPCLGCWCCEACCLAGGAFVCSACGACGACLAEQEGAPQAEACARCGRCRACRSAGCAGGGCERP